MSGSAGTQGICPRDPGGAHPAQAPPGLRCASRACRDMVRQESLEDTGQSFQAQHGASTPRLAHSKKSSKRQSTITGGKLGRGGGQSKYEQGCQRHPACSQPVSLPPGRPQSLSYKSKCLPVIFGTSSAQSQQGKAAASNMEGVFMLQRASTEAGTQRAQRPLHRGGLGPLSSSPDCPYEVT